MSEPKSFIGRRIGATEWNIVDMQETKRNKNTASGSVRVRSGNNSKLLTWSAVNTAPGKWSISGPGARLTNNTVVPNARDFPWMLNSEFNGALRGVLSEWLNHRNGQPQPASTATPVARPPSPPTPPPIPPPAPARKQTAPSPAPQPTRPPAPRLSLTSASPVAPPRVPITPLAVPAVRGEPAMELVHASVAEIIAFRGEQNNDTGAALIKSQPRAYFNPKKLKALGKSLSSPGEQQLPITVIRISDVPNKKYEIVDGERR